MLTLLRSLSANVRYMGATMHQVKVSLAITLLVGFATGLARGGPVVMPDEEYLAPEFAVRYGPGTVVSRADLPGLGVRFTLSGIASGGTGVSDNFPVNDVGQILPSHGNGDFSNFEGYLTRFTNLSPGDVDIALIMNTGFTGPSGVPPNDGTNDTFWQSPWITIAPSASQIVLLDFDAALPHSISDNKPPHTQGSTGQPTVINAIDRTEVSNIGFQVADFNGDLAGQTTILAINIPEPNPDFDGDGDVDGKDFLVWQSDPSVGSLADWEANYGAGAPLSEGSAAVPEPTAMVLACVATLCLAMSKRRSPSAKWLDA